MKNFVILLATSLLLVSCGGNKSHPRMLSFTPASVVIDYSDNDLHEATSLAQQFCSSINRDAQYVRTEEGGWITRERKGFFNCIESNRGVRTHKDSGSTPIINNFK